MKKELATKIKIKLVITPLLFTFLAIFFFSSNLWFFLIGGAAIFVFQLVGWHFLFGDEKNFIDKLENILPFLLITIACVGLSASTILTLEKIELIANPDHVTPCSLSPVVACSPIINSDEASAFGDVPNPLLGIFGFACLLTAGITMLALQNGGKKIASWYYKILFVGTLFGVGFSAWLMYQSLYDIGSLCIFCMSVWLMSVIACNYVGKYLYLRNHFNNKKIDKKIAGVIANNHFVIPFAIIVIVIILIYFRFDYYWNSLV